MKKIADDIGTVIMNYYEAELLEMLFSFGFTIEDIIFQVLVLCCRYAYLINAEKHSISYFIEEEGLEYDLARKEHERIIKYVLKKDRLANDKMEQKIGDSFRRLDISASRKANRFPEYSFSQFDYWEIRNIHDMGLVKSIVERRISSAKKVSNDRFIALAKQYDSSVITMKNNFGKDPESTVFSSLQLFTLQQKYSFDFLYEVADAMERLNIKEFPEMYDRIMTVTGTYKCNSVLPELVPLAAADSDRKIEYQFILQRGRIIPQILGDNDVINLVLGSFIEGNTLVNAIRSHMSLGGMPLPQVVAEETDINDWASVFEMYNVFRTFIPDKKWSEAKIKAVRKMYDLISLDYRTLEHPENRP